MNQILKSLACVAVFAGIGFIVSQQMQPATQAPIQSAAAENKMAERVLPRAPASEHADQMPPATDERGNYGYVNKARLATLAGQPYDGPSYKETYAVEQKMVADRKAAAKKDRMPANSNSK